MSVGGQATSFGSNTATETTTQSSYNTDSSRSNTQATEDTLGAGAVRGATLGLTESSGNVFNLADPTMTIAAAGIAQSGLADAFAGLQRITDTSNMAVQRALDLAETVQGGQGDQVKKVTQTLLVGAVIVAVSWVLVSALTRKKKRGA